MQVMLEVTVVAQTLHLEQVTNHFRNHLGSFFSKKKTSSFCLLVFYLLFHLSLLKERILIMSLDHRDYDHVNLFHVGLGVVFLV